MLPHPTTMFHKVSRGVLSFPVVACRARSHCICSCISLAVVDSIYPIELLSRLCSAISARLFDHYFCILEWNPPVQPSGLCIVLSRRLHPPNCSAICVFPCRIQVLSVASLGHCKCFATAVWSAWTTRPFIRSCARART